VLNKGWLCSTFGGHGVTLISYRGAGRSVSKGSVGQFVVVVGFVSQIVDSRECIGARFVAELVLSQGFKV
jgi:hypothetical protein